MVLRQVKRAASTTGMVLLLLLLAPLASGDASADDGDEGVRGTVRKESIFMKLVPADKLELGAGQHYQQTLQEATQAHTLMPAKHPQVVRLRAIANRLLPHAEPWNPRAKDWQWEVNLLDSPQLNAYCMPGGKIAFYTGILARLQLSDDEVAAVMGHEIAHALREHSRKRLGQTMATRLGAGAVSAALGLQGAGNQVVGMGAKLLTLKFSRGDESEADIVGMELAARAGFDPQAGVSLWQKMGQISAGAQSQPGFLSTHPAGERRIQQIEAMLPKVTPLYERAPKPPQAYGPPPAVPAK